MTDFQINDQNQVNRSIRRPVRKRGIANRLIDWGVAQNEQQANLIMIGITIVLFIAIIFINMRTFSTPAPAPFDEFDEAME